MADEVVTYAGMHTMVQHCMCITHYSKQLLLPRHTYDALRTSYRSCRCRSEREKNGESAARACNYIYKGKYSRHVPKYLNSRGLQR